MKYSIAALASLLLFSCSNNDDHLDTLRNLLAENDFTTSFQPESFRTPPTSIEQITYIIRPDKTISDTLHATYAFTNGRVVRIDETDSTGHTSYTELTYDNKGRITSLDFGTSEGSYNKDVFTFEENMGRLAKKENIVIGMEPDLTFYAFPDQVKKLHFHWNFPNNPVNRFEYDLTPKDDSTRVAERWYSNGNLFSSNYDMYDQHNRLCSHTMLDDGDRIDRQVFYTYDSLDNVTSRIEKDADNALGGNGVLIISTPTSEIITYEYDTHANWTKRTKTNGHSRSIVSVRKIMY